MTTKYKLVGMAFFLSLFCVAQQTYGTIYFERKTNLKKLKQWDLPMYKDYIEESPTVTENFLLQFNDTCSFYDYEENQSQINGWMTTKTSYYNSINSQARIVKFDFWGEEIFIQDTTKSIEWKITNNKRTIMEYECVKAIWQKNDSTRLYAWFTPMLPVSIGPDGISGLPGAILGLAREDGSIVYFAKRYTNEFDIKSIRKNIKTNKRISKSTFFKKLDEKLSNDEQGRFFLADIKRWF
jgi:GLPGLI family protein